MSKLGHFDLSDVELGGWVHEDLMDRIFDISRIPLPVTDMIGTDTADNEYKEWSVDELNNPDTGNSYGDKHTWTTENDQKLGNRVGNLCQLAMKRVTVTTRAQNVRHVGANNALSYQLINRQRELRRDIEAIIVANQASFADPNSGTGSGGAYQKGDGNKMGGLASWLKTNWYDTTGAQANAGGFNTTTGRTVAYTPSAPGDLSEALVRQVGTSVWEQGGDPTKLVGRPGPINAFSDYLFSSSARVATLQSETGQQASGVTAKGFVDVFVSNNGVVLDLIGNRLQALEDPGGIPYTTLYFIDPAYLSIAYLHGYRVEPLAKSGPHDDRQMLVDATLVVHTEKAHGCIANLKDAPTVSP